jgi:hypothetical protein
LIKGAILHRQSNDKHEVFRVTFVSIAKENQEKIRKERVNDMSNKRRIGKKIFKFIITCYIVLSIPALMIATWFISGPVRTIISENVPQTEQEAQDLGYTLLGASESKFHQNASKENLPNHKYVSPNGRREVVYFSDGTLNEDPRDVGTYNFFPFFAQGENQGVLASVGHGLLDVVPYMIWGNSSVDSSTFIDRIEMMVA